MKISSLVHLLGLLISSSTLTAFRLPKYAPLTKLGSSLQMKEDKVDLQQSSSNAKQSVIQSIHKFAKSVLSPALGLMLLTTGSSILTTTMLPSPVLSESLQDVNAKLSNYGFAPVLFVPDGFSPLVSEYGRGGLKEAMSSPILVQFVYPSLWVVEKTSMNNNGEAGKIAANDYMKGDSAFLFVQKLAKDKTPILSKDNTDDIKAFILKALSQKGDPVDSLKIYRVDDSKVVGVDGQKYTLVDFAYQLNTEAGFLIQRRAIASLASVGEKNSIQGLVAATTDLRYGKANKPGLENKLRTIVESFRVYRLNSGIFAAEGVTRK